MISSTRRAALIVAALGLTGNAFGALAPDFMDKLTADARPLEDRVRDGARRPYQVMQILGVDAGMTLLDIGAGGGWFTIRLARRVGANGLVYAEDIQPQMLEATMRRVARESLRNVRPVLGAADDPHLPPSALDAVLIVDTYHELDDPDAMLRNIAKSLRPQGRVGVVDFKRDGLGPGPALEDRVDPEQVVRDAEAAGLRLLRRETFLPYQFLLVFSRAQ